MEILTITNEWQLLYNIAYLESGVKYTIQNNSGYPVLFYVGDEVPFDIKTTGVVYNTQTFTDITDSDQLWLKSGSNNPVEIVLF